MFELIAIFLFEKHKYSAANVGNMNGKQKILPMLSGPSRSDQRLMILFKVIFFPVSKLIYETSELVHYNTIANIFFWLCLVCFENCNIT